MFTLQAARPCLTRCGWHKNARYANLQLVPSQKRQNFRVLTRTYRRVAQWPQAREPTTCVSANPTTSSAAAASIAAGYRLVEWLQRRGGKISGVELHFDGLLDSCVTRELRATEDLQPGQCVVMVPQTAMLRRDVVEDERLLRLCARVPPGSNADGPAWQFQQALLVCWHLSRGTHSNFHTYLSVLPGLAPGTAPPQVGMSLGGLESVQDEVQYGPLVQDIHNQHYWWRKFSMEVLDKLPGLPEDPFEGVHIDFHTFGWAVAMASSRSFRHARLGTHLMVPMVDLVDHSNNPNCEMRTLPHSCSSSGDCVDVGLFVMRPVKTGEAISLSYGPHDNSALLMAYGFVVPSNPHDRLWMPYNEELLADVISTFTNNDVLPLASWKRQLLSRQGAVCPGAVWLGGPEVVDPRLLGCLRIMLLQDDAQVLVESMTATKLGDWNAPIARQHEIVVLEALVGQCTALYRSFQTTIQQDQAILAALIKVATKLPPCHIHPDVYEHGRASPRAAAVGGRTPAASPAASTASSGAANAGNANANGGHSSPGTVASDGPRGSGNVLLPQLPQDQTSTISAMKLAVQFRLELKLGLEQTLKRVMQRKRELEDLAAPPGPVHG